MTKKKRKRLTEQQYKALSDAYLGRLSPTSIAGKTMVRRLIHSRLLWFSLIGQKFSLTERGRTVWTEERDRRIRRQIPGYAEAPPS